MTNIKIGITIGDINGVGPEVIIKALGDDRILNQCTPIVYGSAKVISYYKNIIDDSFRFVNISDASKAQEGKVNILNCWSDDVKITMGEATEDGGKYAYISMDKTCDDLIAGKIDAMVTAPINKQAMKMAKFPYPGHTEYLAAKFKSKSNLMMLVSNSHRVALVSNHTPIKDVATTITKDNVKNKLILLHNALQIDFGITKPKIAVLGLNPHASDEGVLGEEDNNIIKPVIIESKKAGRLVMGPFPADGFYGSNMHNKFDGILAMYHDQGLIPFKILSFGSGVNFSAGMDYIRTSVDHGTAYDIVGKNEANPKSLRHAIYSAIDIHRNRKFAADIVVREPRPEKKRPYKKNSRD